VTQSRSEKYLVDLVNELRQLPAETGWVEFKTNNEHPQGIGEYISALANSAALEGKAFAYMVWGIDDETHEPVGTTFDPWTQKSGNEELENWLLRLMTPKIQFSFYAVEYEGHHLVALEIERSSHSPAQFTGVEYVRIGSYKRPLKHHPEKERMLWRIFDSTPYELNAAYERASIGEVLELLSYESYFDLLSIPLPTNQIRIIEKFTEDRLILSNAAGGWDITNLGALLLARNLSVFPTISRKAVRVIQYKGLSKTNTIRDQVGGKGYASGFEGLIRYVNNLIPSTEVIGQAFRTNVPIFPELAIRELIANALIHQDLHITGVGPTIEIYDDRVEITNPGQPIIDPQRFMDSPPRSRNETFASLMRRFNICEERGSGIDKVVELVEAFQLPAPIFEAPENFTRVVLFSHRSLQDMSKADRIRACYLHACLRYLVRQAMTNTTVRERFGIPEQNSAIASRLLSEAVESGMIVIEDPTVGTRARRYLPFWAAPSGDVTGIA